MGYRTHLILMVDGALQNVGTFKNMPTKVYLLDHYSLGKVYFNELPEELDDVIQSNTDEHPLWFNDGGDSDDGEIKVHALLRICKRIKEEQEGKTPIQIDQLPEWFGISVTPVVTVLEQALRDEVIKLDHPVYFECY